jgi:hypothetical protein
MRRGLQCGRSMRPSRRRVVAPRDLTLFRERQFQLALAANIT